MHSVPEIFAVTLPDGVTDTGRSTVRQTGSPASSANAGSEAEMAATRRPATATRDAAAANVMCGDSSQSKQWVSTPTSTS
ncbi:hypothetical protein GCM10027569_16190 [Flindersiella endophytica]